MLYLDPLAFLAHYAAHDHAHVALVHLSMCDGFCPGCLSLASTCRVAREALHHSFAVVIQRVHVAVV